MDWDHARSVSDRKGGDRFAHRQAMDAGYWKLRRAARRTARRAAASAERDEWLRRNGLPTEPANAEVEALANRILARHPPSRSKAQYVGLTKRSIWDEALRSIIERPPGNRPVLVNEDGSVISRSEAEEMGFKSQILYVASRSTIARLEHFITQALHHLPLGQRLHRKVQDFNVSQSLLERDMEEGVEKIMLFLTEAPVVSWRVEEEGGVIKSMVLGGGWRVMVVPNIRAAHGGGGGGRGGASKKDGGLE